MASSGNFLGCDACSRNTVMVLRVLGRNQYPEEVSETACVLFRPNRYFLEALVILLQLHQGYQKYFCNAIASLQLEIWR